MNKQDLLISGYPRSGNTWTARLLGEILDSPVTGYLNAHPIAEEGLTRPGPYTVRQLHLKYSESEHDTLLPDAWTFAARRYQGEKVVFIVRDPRDVAVSAMHYWQRETLDEALDAMIRGIHPLKGVGPWRNFVSPWLGSRIPVVVRYETLLADTADAVTDLLYALRIGPPPAWRIEEAVRNQSFEKRRAEIAANGDRYNYGREVQLRNMRKGTAGDWKNHFTPEQAGRAEVEWGDLLDLLGYERGIT